MLSDWENSNGAKMEFEYAISNNIQILFEDENKGRLDQMYVVNFIKILATMSYTTKEVKEIIHKFGW